MVEHYMHLYIYCRVYTCQLPVPHILYSDRFCACYYSFVIHHLCELIKINSVWNSALFRIYDVNGEQLHLMQLYPNSLPLRTQVLLCCRKFSLACRCVKNGVLELLTIVYGDKELDDCDSLLTICRLA